MSAGSMYAEYLIKYAIKLSTLSIELVIGIGGNQCSMIGAKMWLAFLLVQSIAGMGKKH